MMEFWIYLFILSTLS